MNIQDILGNTFKKMNGVEEELRALIEPFTTKPVQQKELANLGLIQNATLSGPGQNSQGSSTEPGNSLAGISARADPLMSYNWYALLPQITPLGGGLPVSLDWYFVEEASLSFRTFNVMDLYHQGHAIHYPADYSVDQIKLALYADESNKSLNYLNAWDNAIMVPTTPDNAELVGGMYGKPANFKKTISFFLVDANKRKLIEIKYVGCWPVNRDQYSMDSNTSTRIVNHVTISVDNVFVTIHGLTPAAVRN